MNSGQKPSPERSLEGLDLDWEGFNFEQIFKKSATGAPPPPDPRPDKYKILLEVSKRLSANLELDGLLVEILDTVLRVTRMEKGVLMLRDEDERFHVALAQDQNRQKLGAGELEVPRSVIREVARTGRPLYIADIEKKLEMGDPGVRGERAVMCFPLRVSYPARGERPGTEGSRTVGVIYAQSPLREAEFPVIDLEFIEALAAQAGIAVENARLYERLNRDRLVLADENRDLKREVGHKYSFENIVGSSDRMRAVYELIARVSRTSVNVLLRGESGTGKEVVAKTIHYNSERAKKPFVSVNCAALPETLLESELFGIEKGVATGVSKRVGKLELAQGGTFLLDEVGDMSLAIQAKLLRAIESREIERVGGQASIPVDVRIIAATNRDLEAAIRDGSFREDLYFRLNVMPIYLPPLRERRTDIPPLVEHFVRKHAIPQGKAIEGVTRPALESLLAYGWPGNVRELENVVQRAILMCDSNLIDVDDLPPELFERREALLHRALEDGWTAERLVREYALKVLERNKGNLSRTARQLGIDFKTLKKKVEEQRDAGPARSG